MRKLATAAFFFASAIFISRFILPYNWLPVCCAIAAALSLAGLLFRANMRLRIFIALLSLSAGFIWSWTYTALFVAPSWDLHEETATVSAVVADYPSPRATRGYRVDVVIRRDGRPSTGARLYYYNEAALEPGDLIEFTARFRRTDGVGDGDRFDPLNSRGAFLSANVSGDIQVTGAEGGFRYLPKKLANAVANMVDSTFPGDVAHFMKALLVGNRVALNQDAALNAALSASGIIHIVAISGMHISFLMGFLAVILRNKRLFAFIGIPVLILFMAMTGFTPSVTRAGIMQVFLICAPIFRRESDSVTSLSAALLVILARNPYACASVGLQLSFGATLGIILFTGKINAAVLDNLRDTRAYKKKFARAAISFVVSSLATTIGALIFTLPLTAIHFGYVSLIAPLTNLLTIWAVSLAFPIGLAACILGFISLPLGSALAYPVSFAARYIIAVARSLATVPYSIVYSSNAHIIFWLAYVYVMFVTLPLLKARARQYLYPACTAIIVLFALILIAPLMPGAGGTAVTVLNVGQGLSAVVTSGDHAMVVDCGSISGERAGEVAHEFLLNQGRTSIDLLALTHFHEDHVNGVEFLLSRVNVSALVIPDPDGLDGRFIAQDIIELARKRGTDIIYVTETLSVTFGDLEVMFYPPMGFGDDNERGISILTLGEVSALITGDMNSTSERSLLRFAALPKIDLLVVGHHGSKHSTSEELLAAVMPDIAIIPVGRNSFGHPAGETLERLEKFGVTVYRTDEMGHVTVSGR